MLTSTMDTIFVDIVCIILFYCLSVCDTVHGLYQKISILCRWISNLHFCSKRSSYNFRVSGLSSSFEDFPISSLLDNFSDGLSCFTGENPGRDTSYESRDASCDYGYLTILGYIIANVVMLECVDKALQSSDQILNRTTALAVLVAYIVLGFYDTGIGYDDDGLIGTAFNYWDIVSIVILMVGMEVYGRDPEPDVESITQYTPSGK